jgi:glutamyl-tRNA reductase
MSLHVVGLNHQSAPLEVREKVAFPADRQAQALADLAGQPGVAEAVLVSTCNRTEIYVRADDPAAARAWLEAEAGKSGLDVRPHLYVHTDEPPCAMHSAWRAGWTPWSWASRRSWAR